MTVRRATLLLLGLVVVMLTLTASFLRAPSRSNAQVTGTIGAPAFPTIVDAGTLPASGAVLRADHPRRHPGGEVELEREKTAASGAVAGGSSVSAASSLAPVAGLGFDGIDDAESACGCLPPDGAIAVGPNRIVGAVNTAFKVWDKSGNPIPGFPKGLSSLFANQGCLASVSDPFAEYDPAADRFVLGALTYDSNNNSVVCVAVTKTGDPGALWQVYAFTVATAHDLFDFPHATIGSDAIYVTGNQFQNGSTFTGARVYAYNKAQMYAGQAAGSVFVDVGNNAAGKQADTLTPVRGVTVASTAYFIAADNASCPCSNISIWRWSNPFGASSFSLSGGVTVTSYGQPPNAQQPGRHAGTIVTNDAGNLGAYWYAGTVYGAHTVSVNPPPGTVAGVQWYQLGNPNGQPSLIQQGVVAAPGQYRFFPNLSVDTSGSMTLAYAYSSSSASDFAGIRYTGRLAGDPLGTLQTEAVLKAGQQTVNGSRYGDYAGQALDPDGCTVWHLEEYARSGSLWGTWVGSIRASACGGSTTPTPTASATVTVTATVTRTPTPSSTRTATPTNTVTATPTNTPTATPSSTRTRTPTNTVTATPTNTATATPTNTVTATPTGTPSSLPTSTQTLAPTETATATNTTTAVPTDTSTPTPAPSDTATSTATPTPSDTTTPTATSTATVPVDTDGDGIPDVVDNCPLIPNPGQENTTKSIDNGPGVSGDDTTVPVSHTEGDACSTDADADGLADAQELASVGCGSFDLSTTTHPNPARGDITNDDNHDGNPAPPMGTDVADNGPSSDTDNDGVLDGAECVLGTDPRDPSSKPTALQCANFAQPTPGVGPNTATTDADGDGLAAAWEYCKWGTSDTSVDSDGDGKGDCQEAVDVDGNGVINFAGDSLATAKAALGVIGKTQDFDLNGDGVVNFAGDAIASAKRALAVTPCL